MKRYEKCRDIIWEFDELSEKIVKYQRKPHTYGDENELYMQQMHTLVLIGRNPGINVKTLADMKGKSRATLSQQITRLEKLGYVRKQRNEENQREVILKLTEAGEKKYHYHEEDDNRFYKRLIDECGNFSLEELSVVERFVKCFSKAFDLDEEQGFNK